MFLMQMWAGGVIWALEEVDPNFNPSINGGVTAICELNNRKILIGGSFTQVNGTAIETVARLNPDGSLDPSFTPAALTNVTPYAFAEQADGKILLGGSRDNRQFLERLTASGEKDTNFNAEINSAVGAINPVKVQADGKILIMDSFSLTRLLPDGRKDTNFDWTIDPNVLQVRQTDGKIITYAATQVPGPMGPLPAFTVGRLDGTGNPDPTFNGTAPTMGTLRQFGLLNDESIWLLWSPMYLSGMSTVNGPLTLSTIGAEGGGWVHLAQTGTWEYWLIGVVHQQRDGNILLGGSFSSMNGVARANLARLLAANPGPAINVQPAAATVPAGDTARFTVAVSSPSVPSYQWQLNGTDLPGATNRTLTLPGVQRSQAGLYQVVVRNSAGQTNSQVASLRVTAAEGSLDLAFGAGAGANGPVNALALQTDGKIVIGGSFDSYDGVSRNGIARLNRDGTLDASFDPGAGVGGPTNAAVFAMGLTAEGKVVIAGTFTNVNNQSRANVARLNQDGSLDALFVPSLGPAQGGVIALAVEADGQVLAGYQTQRNDAALVRLTGSGTVAMSLAVNMAGIVPIPPPVYLKALALDGNGKIWVGGEFNYIFREAPGTTGKSLARLNADGSMDVPSTITLKVPGGESIPTITAFTPLPDGRFIAAGKFSFPFQTAVHQLGRLESNGGFGPVAAPFNGDALCLAAEGDGQILVGGRFTTAQGADRPRISRLNQDLTLDQSFFTGAGPNDEVRAVAVQSDGDILIGGAFTQVDGKPRGRIARLFGTPVLQLVNPAKQQGKFSAYAATQSGKTYTLEFKTSLSAGPWNVVTNYPGNGDIQIFVDLNAADSQRFYRLRVQP